MSDTAVATKKHAGGRPTLYDPKYCEAVVDFMKQGFTATAFAGEIGVSRNAIYEWADRHSEFGDALTRGQAASLRWWEEVNRTNALGKVGSDAATIFALKNIGRLDWRDKIEVKAETKVEHVVDVDLLASDELIQLAELVRQIKARREEPVLVGSGSTVVTNGSGRKANGSVGKKKNGNGAA